MDPLSVAASVTGLLMAGVQISSALQTLISDSAATAITAQTITQELHDFSIILSQLQHLILGAAFSSHHRASMIDADHLIIVIMGCVCTFSELEKEVSGLGSWEEMNFWDRRKWTKAGSKLGPLVQRLQNQKLSLNLIMATLTWQGYQRSESCGTNTSPDQATSNVDRLCQVVEKLVATNIQMSQRLHMVESRLAMLGPSAAGNSSPFANVLDSTNAHNTNTAASIRTITSYRSIASYQSTTAYRLTFEKVLFKTRVYKSALRNASRSSVSLTGSGVRGTSWSILSGVSLAEVSNISVLSLPLCLADLFNPQWYIVPELPEPTSRRRRSRTNSAFASAAIIPSIVAGGISGREPAPSAEGLKEIGFTSLQLAAKLGQDEIVQALIIEGADIEATGEHWYTPLQIAAEAGHEKVVVLLLVNGAQVDTQGVSVNAALHLAAAHGLEPIVRVLLASGAKVDITNRVLYTPLHLASRSGHNEVVSLLLEKGAHIDAKESNWNTPLHIAALYAQKSTVRLLLENAADTEVINRNGYTPLRLAAKYWDKTGHSRLLNIGVPFIQGYQLEQAEPTFRLLFDMLDKDRVGDDLDLLVNSAISHGQKNILHLLHERQAQNTKERNTELTTNQIVGVVEGQQTTIIEPADSSINNESQASGQINVLDLETDSHTPLPTAQLLHEDPEVPEPPGKD